MSTSSSSQPSVAALRPRWRGVRVAALGATSLLLATSAHAVGGGDLPAPGVLAGTAGCARSATNTAAPVLQLGCRASRLRAERPGGCRSPVGLRVCHARRDGDDRRWNHQLGDDRWPHRGNSGHRLAARARRGVVVAHRGARDSRCLADLDGTGGRRSAWLDHRRTDVAVGWTGVRRISAARPAGSALKRRFLRHFSLPLSSRFTHPDAVCCEQAAAGDPSTSLTTSQGELSWLPLCPPAATGLGGPR